MDMIADTSTITIVVRMLLERDDLGDVDKLNVLSTCHAFRNMLGYTTFTGEYDYEKIKYLDSFYYKTGDGKKMRVNLLDNFTNIYTTTKHGKECIDPRVRTLKYTSHIIHIPEHIRTIHAQRKYLGFVAIPEFVHTLILDVNIPIVDITIMDGGKFKFIQNIGSKTIPRQNGIPLNVRLRVPISTTPRYDSRWSSGGGHEIWIKR